MKKQLPGHVLIIVLLTLSMTTIYAQKNILTLGGGASKSEYASDSIFVDKLTEWGYTVTYMDDDDFAATVPNWAEFDGLFINEPISSGNALPFGPDRDNFVVPCVCLEGWAANPDRWAWVSEESQYTENSTGSDDELVFVVWDNTHYITNNYNAGEEITWSTNTADISEIKLRAIMEVNVDYTYKLGKDKALNDEDDFWGMIAIDSSDVFPNRMLWWGLNNYAMNGSELTGNYMTDDLYTLLKRCCDWAYYGGNPDGTSPVEEMDQEKFQLSISPNPCNNQVSVTFYSDNASGAGLTLYSVHGQYIEQFSRQVKVGLNTLVLEFDGYNPGIYVLKLQIAETVAASKLVIR